MAGEVLVDSSNLGELAGYVEDSNRCGKTMTIYGTNYRRCGLVKSFRSSNGCMSIERLSMSTKDIEGIKEKILGILFRAFCRAFWHHLRRLKTKLHELGCHYIPRCGDIIYERGGIGLG